MRERWAVTAPSITTMPMPGRSPRWMLWSTVLPAEQVFCFATGNTARMRNLDCGLLEPGRSADFVFMDKAQHSAGRDLLDSVRKGDLPGVGMAIIDGIVRCGRSRNTPPAERVPAIAH